MGNVYKAPPQALSPSSIELRQMHFVGGYAIQPVWGDGHSTGLYTFDYLSRLARRDS